MDLFQNSKKVVVVNTVKSLGCVNEKKVVLLLFVEFVVVGAGKFVDVVFT